MQFCSGLDQEQGYEAALRIGDMAYRALLEEVYTSPKPGLVDLYSNGAHRDMDVFTFERSAAALKPYFADMALEGVKSPEIPGLLFSNIRRLGLAAENAMFQATDGVNTHKGLIFHMGILCAAVGACIRADKIVTIKTLIEMEQAMVRKTLLKEVSEMRDFTTNGEKNMRRYGTMGARGEAISGYASIRQISLPVMRKGLLEGKDWNRIKLETLFALMSQVDDSNIIARHDIKVLRAVQKKAEAFLKDGGAYKKGALTVLKRMDAEFIEKNISAGGCADLMAITIFLTELLQKYGKK